MFEPIAKDERKDKKLGRERPMFTIVPRAQFVGIVSVE